MKRVALVTDSTCDLPRELAEQLDIRVVPLTVVVDGEPTLDDDSRPREELHGQIARARRVSTSQPSPGEFAQAYRDLIARGLEIVSVHVSAGLSGTFRSAELGWSVSGGKVEVVDSGTASLAMGFAVVDAARAACSGASRAEVLAAVSRTLKSTFAYFTVGSLGHLQKIGRLGRLQAIIGSLLDVRPILYVREGGLALKERLRGEAQVISRLVELIGEHVNRELPVRCAIVHIEAHGLAQRLRDEVVRVYDCTDVLITRAGGVMAAAVGPGSVGLFFGQA